MINFTRFGKCLAGNTNFSALIKELLQKVQTLTNKLRDQKYSILLLRTSRPEVFCKKGVLRNFTKFTGKHLCQSLFFNKVAGLRPATLLKKRLWHRCFPVNFVKFLRTPFFIEHLWWLLFFIPIYFFSFTVNWDIKTLTTEAVVRGCSAKKVFLEISQNSQENTCARDSF